MAGVLKFARATTEVDLNGGMDNTPPNGFIIQDKYWDVYPFQMPKMGAGDPPPIVEKAIPVVCVAPTADALATHMQSIHEMQRWSREYMAHRMVEHPVWLHAQWEAETGERRALVREIRVQPAKRYRRGDDLVAVELDVVVVREPLWERAAERDMPQASCDWADLYDYTAAGSVVAAHDIIGDVPVRIDHLMLQAQSGDDLGRAWMGIRSDDKCPGGNAANFANIWECEDGTNNPNESGISDDTTSDTDGASPGGGNGAYVEVTETDLDWDDTWHEAMAITLSDVTSNESDQFGLNLWLLRAKVTAGTWEVQFRYGYDGMDDDQYIQGSIVEISATSWEIHEMGVRNIPLRDLQSLPLSVIDDGYEASFEIQVWARRTSGSGDLHLDCILPVPQDEGYLKIWDVGALSVADLLIFSQSPHGRENVGLYDLADSAWTNRPPFVAGDFALPPGDGRIVFVGADIASSDITYGYTFNLTDWGHYYERWLSLRGEE